MLILVLGSASAAPSAGAGESILYDSFGRLLEKFVDEEGMVDYAGLKRQPQLLSDFVGRLASLPEEVYQRWDSPSQIAFWINAYNGLTLQAIVDHYPIRASFWKSIRFPKNSIRQIDGVWDELRFPVMARKLTLDQIEHEILRKDFQEPRIHLALVCAARGCPPLRREPYRGHTLDSQLQDQTRRFLAHSGKFRLDRKGGKVYLSMIFRWYGEDFVPLHLPTSGFRGHSQAERAVLNYLSSFLSEEERIFLREGRYRVDYLDYDWSLNEQEAPGKGEGGSR